MCLQGDFISDFLLLKAEIPTLAAPGTVRRFEWGFWGGILYCNYNKEPPK